MDTVDLDELKRLYMAGELEEVLEFMKPKLLNDLIVAMGAPGDTIVRSMKELGSLRDKLGRMLVHICEETWSAERDLAPEAEQDDTEVVQDEDLKDYFDTMRRVYQQDGAEGLQKFLDTIRPPQRTLTYARAAEVRYREVFSEDAPELAKANIDLHQANERIVETVRQIVEDVESVVGSSELTKFAPEDTIGDDIDPKELEIAMDDQTTPEIMRDILVGIWENVPKGGDAYAELKDFLHKEFARKDEAWIIKWAEAAGATNHSNGVGSMIDDIIVRVLAGLVVRDEDKTNPEDMVWIMQGSLLKIWSRIVLVGGDQYARNGLEWLGLWADGAATDEEQKRFNVGVMESLADRHVMTAGLSLDDPLDGIDAQDDPESPGESKVGALNTDPAKSITVYDNRRYPASQPYHSEGGAYFAVMSPEGDLLIEIRSEEPVGDREHGTGSAKYPVSESDYAYPMDADDVVDIPDDPENYWNNWHHPKVESSFVNVPMDISPDTFAKVGEHIVASVDVDAQVADASMQNEESKPKPFLFQHEAVWTQPMPDHLLQDARDDAKNLVANATWTEPQPAMVSWAKIGTPRPDSGKVYEDVKIKDIIADMYGKPITVKREELEDTPDIIAYVKERTNDAINARDSLREDADTYVPTPDAPTDSVKVEPIDAMTRDELVQALNGSRATVKAVRRERDEAWKVASDARREREDLREHFAKEAVAHNAVQKQVENLKELLSETTERYEALQAQLEDEQHQYKELARAVEKQDAERRQQMEYQNEVLKDTNRKLIAAERDRDEAQEQTGHLRAQITQMAGRLNDVESVNVRLEDDCIRLARERNKADEVCEQLRQERDKAVKDRKNAYDTAAKRLKRVRKLQAELDATLRTVNMMAFGQRAQDSGVIHPPKEITITPAGTQNRPVTVWGRNLTLDDGYRGVMFDTVIVDNNYDNHITRDNPTRFQARIHHAEEHQDEDGTPDMVLVHIANYAAHDLPTGQIVGIDPDTEVKVWSN